MTATLTIHGSGTSLAIMQHGRILARASSHASAQARAHRLECSLAHPIQPRACLCCGATFDSAHKGNRLCRQCKDAA